MARCDPRPTPSTTHSNTTTFDKRFDKSYHHSISILSIKLYILVGKFHYLLNIDIIRSRVRAIARKVGTIFALSGNFRHEEKCSKSCEDFFQLLTDRSQTFDNVNIK